MPSGLHQPTRDVYGKRRVFDCGPFTGTGDLSAHAFNAEDALQRLRLILADIYDDDKEATQMTTDPEGTTADLAARLTHLAENLPQLARELVPNSANFHHFTSLLLGRA